MIPRLPASPRSPRAILAMALSLLGLAACQDRAADGGTTDGTSTVAFYLPDGKPAAGARVQVFASSDTTRTPRAQAFTDANGEVELPVLDSSYYNLVARDKSGRAMFQDSLLSNGRSMDYASDTLVATGVVTGRVKVQPQHDPRIVWIALLGAGTYLNVDDSGRFRIEGVPEGKFTLGGFTKTEGYTTTYKALRVKRDSTSDIGVLNMVFTGLPVVKNLEARFDTLAGLVHLRWDSIPLRETWRYTVRRDGMKVGETIGARWIDTVSDEYPKDVPSEGRHTYQVVVSDAMVPGPVWETIEMRIISAYLYQEVKVDWVRKSALPWPKGSFEVEVVDGFLCAWRSAEYGSLVQLQGDSVQRETRHGGLVERWESRDSGATWSKVVDSLRLGSLPLRHDGLWWAVREKSGPLERWKEERWGPSALEVFRPAEVTKFYDTLVVVTSSDGRRWDSVATLSGFSGVTGFRFEKDSSRLWLVASRYAFMVNEDVAWWSLDGGLWNRHPAKSWSEAGKAGIHARWVVGSVEETRWNGGLWQVTRTGWVSPTTSGWKINGAEVPDLLPVIEESSTSYVIRAPALDNIPRVLPLTSERKAIFSEDTAISMDSDMRNFHPISWPGGGFHRELMWGGRILSVSDNGVYLGRILSGLEGGDPRGTWAKKTETPRVF